MDLSRLTFDILSIGGHGGAAANGQSKVYRRLGASTVWDITARFTGTVKKYTALYIGLPLGGLIMKTKTRRPMYTILTV